MYIVCMICIKIGQTSVAYSTMANMHRHFVVGVCRKMHALKKVASFHAIIISPKHKIKNNTQTNLFIFYTTVFHLYIVLFLRFCES